MVSKQDLQFNEDMGNQTQKSNQGESQSEDSKPKEELKYKDALLAYSNAALGISMVVAC